MTAPQLPEEQLARIEQAVRRLPHLEREVFLAVRLDDLTYGEIAERTGLSTGQVQRLFARALAGISRNPPDQRRRWWRWFRHD